MSITKDFETRRAGCMECGGARREDIDALLGHARVLETMLEWAVEQIEDEHGSGFDHCPTCEKVQEIRKLLGII